MIGNSSVEIMPYLEYREEVQIRRENSREEALDFMMECNFPDECGIYTLIDFFIDGSPKFTKKWSMLCGKVAVIYYIGVYKTI